MTKFTVILALLLAAIAPSAHAETDATCSRSADVNPGIGCKDQGMATTAALAALQDSIKRYPSPSYPDMVACGISPDNEQPPNGVRVQACASGSNPLPVRTYIRYYDQSCATRPNLYQGGDVEITRGDTFCGNGCEYKIEPTKKQTLDTPGKDDVVFARGTLKPSGKACASPNPPPLTPPKGQVCVETLGGHTVCYRDDGKTCVTSGTTGRTYCAPDGHGTNATNPNRTENVTISPPVPGQTPPPAKPPTPRPGEDWKPNGTANITNHTGGNVSNITINNNAGTPNTNPNDGNPDDGSGNPGLPGGGGGTGTSQGDGDGGLKPNSVGGGGSCGSGYSCSGGDQALCAILREQHQARCNAEKGAGEGDLGGAEGGMGEGIGKLFGGEGPSTSVLDVLGNYIGSQPGCPSNPQVDAGSWGSFELPLDKICPHLKLLGTLLLGFAYLLAVKIMLE
ncbi:virulence factor TspB C-terminal domain-related protein [Lysobacter firmicutimachus]|uniref:Virulence factor TspB C-terminal domain-related protein n=1 Tax=Lysobacter firmicutimachus TaxID=1792846 RepID=A0ABU8D4L2_9GAMM